MPTTRLEIQSGFTKFKTPFFLHLASYSAAVLEFLLVLKKQNQK